MTDAVHVFVYDPDRFAGVESHRIRDDVVQGTLFDVEDVGPALMLAGSATVPGEVRRIGPASLALVDSTARVDDGLYRRVGVLIGATPCWAWVAGPLLAQRLAASRPGTR